MANLHQTQDFRRETTSGSLPHATARRFDAFFWQTATPSCVALPLGVLSAALELTDDWPGRPAAQRWPSGELQASCFRAISPVTELAVAAKTGVLSRLLRGDLPIPTHPSNGAEPEEVQWISFACVLISSRGGFSAIGPMDEFFMYFEDVDYCRRASRAGWRMVYVPEARVVHLRGGYAPDQFAQEERKRRPRFYYESRSRYLAKYYGPTGPLRANICWSLGRGISLAREFVGGKSPHTACGEGADIWTGALCGFSRTFPNSSH